MTLKHDKNEAEADHSPEPRIGIFWYLNKDLVTYSVPVSEITEHCGFKDVDMGHYKFWPTLQKLDKNLRSLEYDEVPRGRVLYDEENKTYKVYASSQLTEKETFKSIVLRVFNLPEGSTQFESDLHYEPPGSVNWDE